jgi:hypothetical protein
MPTSRAHLSLILVAAALALTAGADVAAAQPQAIAAATEPPPLRMYVVGGGVNLRLGGMDPASAAWDGALDVNGYHDLGSTLTGVNLFAAWRGAPLVDLGVAAEYSYVTHARPPGQEIGLRSHVRQLGAFARLRPWPRSVVDAGLRLDAGVIGVDTTLRQETVREIAPFARAQLDVLAGGERTGLHLHVGMQRVLSRDADPYLPAPVGGLDFGVGIYRRY